MPPTKAKKLYAAKSQFWLGNEFFRKGRIVEEGDPVLDKHEAQFEPYVPTGGDQVHRGQPRIEQATAAPGEKR